MSISEQVRELRIYASTYEESPFGREVEGTAGVLRKAADTIESLTAKLADIERSAEEEKAWRYCKECEYYAPLPNGVRGVKRGHCEKRYPRDNRRGCTRACKMFVEKDNINEP